VFHFKQRISDIEEKSETMFLIINDIVKELSSVKQNCCIQLSDNKPINLCCMPPVNVMRQEKIIVSDEELDDDEDDDDDDDDDYDEDDDEDDENPPPLNITEDPNLKIITVDIDETVQLLDNEEQETVNIETVNLLVEKIEGESETVINEPTLDTSKDIYRKMTLPALKACVITKGLSTDPSKMKKNELLKLLEANEE